MKKIILGFLICCIFMCSITPAQALDVKEQSAIQNLIYRGSYSSAKTKIDAAISSDATDPVPHMLKGMYYQWYQVNYNKNHALDNTILQWFEKAKTLAEAKVNKDPNNLTNQTMLGNALM